VYACHPVIREMIEAGCKRIKNSSYGTGLPVDVRSGWGELKKNLALLSRAGGGEKNDVID